jgi:hypothetical protein
MIPRERHTSGGLPTAIADLPKAQASLSAVRSDIAGREASWEELSSCLSSLKHRDLLDLAHQKGLLYNCPLPRLPANGLVLSGCLTPHRVQILSQLLRGELSGLTPAPAESVLTSSGELDLFQRHAVARALATPDLCLIQAPAAGTPRLAAEVVTQAVQQRQRVLLLAHSAPALDAILEMVAGRDPIYALRCVAPGEILERLSAPVRALTFRERSRILRERALDCARQASAETQQRMQAHAHEEAVWQQLQQLCQTRMQLEHRLAELQIAALQLEQVQCRVQLSSIDQELEVLRPLAMAKRHGRWWTLAFWRASAPKVSRFAELQAAEKNLQAKLDHLTGQLAALLPAGWSSNDPPPLVVMAGATAATEIDRLRQECAALNTSAQQLLAGWEPLPFCPAAIDHETLQQTHLVWEKQVVQEKEKASFLNRWVEYLEKSGETLAGRLPRLANLVAATLAALPGDEHFGQGHEEQTFDLLILEGAHRLSEPELMQLATRAARWVLIGEPPPAVDVHTDGPRGTTRKPEAGRKAITLTGPRRPPTPPHWFHRLGRLLHCDPSRSPYRWGIEQGRLFCRLRAVPVQQHKFLESETVADRPDIELRILNQPRAEPVLAEVLFPDSTPVTQAKEYIYRELQEVAVQTLGRNLCWQEEEQRLVLRLTDQATGEAASAVLEKGIIEHLVRAAPADDGSTRWHTVGLEFDRRQGWTLERAREWLLTHLGWRDLGRSLLVIDPAPGRSG